MRWLALVVIVMLGACGGSVPSRPPITNSTPPPSSLSICEDTVTRYPPQIELGLVIDEETLLARSVREHEPVLRNCYLQRLRQTPRLGGKVVVDITVGADGRATHIHTRGFDAAIDRCLCEKLTALQFETLSGGEVKASYSLYFSPPAL